MNVISFQVLETLVQAELSEEGASPYYIVKKRNLYPAFAYKFIKKTI